MAEMILVKVAPLGRTVAEVLIPEGSTISTALAQAASTINVTGYDNLSKNGKAANTYDTVFAGDIITLVPNIRGGN